MNIQHLKHGDAFRLNGVLCFKIDIKQGIEGYTAFINTTALPFVSYMSNE